MQSMAAITRGLKAARKVSQFQAAVSEAMTALETALRSKPRLQTDLRRSLKDMKDWQIRLSMLPSMSGLSEVAKADIVKAIIRAWVNVAGAQGELRASRTVSFWKEAGQAAKELPANVFRPIGEVLGETAAIAGNAAGSAVGGLLSGLGPVMAAIAVIVVYVKFFKKRR